MVRTKATAIRTFGGKANTKGKKGGGDDDIKVKVPKNVTTVAPNEKVVNLAGFLNENYKPNKKPTERKKTQKVRRHSSGTQYVLPSVRHQPL